MKKLLLLIATFTLASVVAFAADITGKWVGDANAGGKGGPPTFNFKQDGSTLTGSQEGGRGGPVDISNAKLDGDNISFEVTREFNGNSITTKYHGTISGNTMKLTMETARGNRDITLTKQ